MKYKHLSFLIFLILSLLLSCGKGSFRETEEGIIIKLPPSSKSAPDLIRIKAKPDHTINYTGTEIILKLQS